MNNHLNVSAHSYQNIQANRIYHDDIAEKYEKDPRVRLGVMHPNCWKRLEWLKKRYSIQKDNSLILNLGVGTGNLMKESGEILGYTIGLDISANMLKLAKRYTNRLIQGNALQMPLKSQSLDVVFCIALLHHIYDLENFFRSVYRVLTSGGIFYSDYDPNRGFYITIARSRLFSFLISLYKKISDIFIYEIEDERRLRKIHDVAEYHEVFLQGLEPDEVVGIVKKVGFSKVNCICHSDAPNLDYPRKGRLIHKISELLLTPFSIDYTNRAKIFSIIAVK